MTFLGYEAVYKTSKVSGLKRLYYDRTKSFTKRIPYKNTFVAGLHLTKPTGYLIPQGWRNIITRLKRNGVRMNVLPNDTVIAVSAYYWDDYKTGSRPYEGHYMHTGVKVRAEVQRLPFYRGDYFIPTNRYLVETLEPQAMDSFFVWNFFDSVLDQKEYFANYIFEATAAKLLSNSPTLRQ